MADEKTKVSISICMGSSCYSRGNRQNLEVLQDYLRRNGLEGRVQLKGKLCEGLCKAGPNIKVGGETCSRLTPATLVALLDRHFQPEDSHASSDGNRPA